MKDYSVENLQKNSMNNKYKVSAYFEMPSNFLNELLDLRNKRPNYYSEDKLH